MVSAYAGFAWRICPVGNFHSDAKKQVEMKTMSTALVTNIQGYSIHDGPGIRTVVFLKGCSLACQWCANPESIAPQVQIGFIKNLCTGCGKCFAACPKEALSKDPTKKRIDYSKCVACGKCVEACAYKAMVQYGKPMTVKEVLDAVGRDKMFYETSGGGVTVSGGEPLLHAGFVKELFEMCNDEGINTCVETAGFVPAKAFLSILPVTNHLLFDLKHMDSDKHLKYTGQHNTQILANARIVAESGADVLFRIPLIPSVNDSDENIGETAAFVKSLLRHPKVQLMPFHRLGDSKYKALGVTTLFDECSTMQQDALERVKQMYIEEGVECSISK